jgi:hypothetical protein
MSEQVRSADMHNRTQHFSRFDTDGEIAQAPDLKLQRMVLNFARRSCPTALSFVLSSSKPRAERRRRGQAKVF